MNDLKPCPFCGGTAIYETKSNKTTMSGVGFSFTIRCSSCRVCIPKWFDIDIRLNQKGEIDIETDQREKAAEIWNGRNNNV
jgi:Lar family restriction alleviation protein